MRISSKCVYVANAPRTKFSWFPKNEKLMDRLPSVHMHSIQYCIAGIIDGI